MDAFIDEDTPQSKLYEIIMKNQNGKDFWNYCDEWVNKHQASSSEQPNSSTELNSYIRLLQANHNLIFHGALGTGKSFTAKQIAMQMILGKVMSEEELSDKEKAQMKEQCGFVQFHPVTTTPTSWMDCDLPRSTTMCKM